MRLGRCLVLTHPARLGDSVLSLPLQRALASETSLTTNVGPPYRFLFELASVEAQFSGPLYPKGFRELMLEARSLRLARFDSVFLVRPNFRSALLARLAHIPVRIGDATEGRGALLTHTVAVPPRANQLRRLREFGARVGVDVRGFGVPSVKRLDPPTIGIVPGASYHHKLIPPEPLREVCINLVSVGYQLALLGGPGEEPWAEPLKDLPTLNWIGKYSLRELVEPLSSLSAVVSADGGLYHLAVACGVPSVGVYGPTAGKFWWHDWGQHVPVLAPHRQMKNVTADQLMKALNTSLSGPLSASHDPKVSVHSPVGG